MSKAYDWIPFRVGEMLPQERRFVLVQIDKNDSKGMPPSVAVGYLRYAAGDKSCPFFVIPGHGRASDPITHWCDCLGDEFHAPGWLAKQIDMPAGVRRRRWESPKT